MRTLGLFALAIFILPIFVHATELININTADKKTLMELKGIGDTLANRIIEYRETNGPFSTIEELIHPNIEKLYQSVFDKIKDYITVGDTSVPDTSDPTASSTPSTTASTTAAIVVTASSSPPPEYIPIPTLHIITSDARTVSSGADTAFTAVVYDGKGNKRDDTLVTWSFGDGMRRTGASVFHEYYDPGEYLAVVRATTSDGGNTQKEIIVTVKDANIKITGVTPRGITLMNSDSRALDLSLWRLSAGGKEFKIPEDTQILAGHTILFPSQVIELPATDSASLLYPSGEVAATYPEAIEITKTAAPLQPSSGTVSYEQVQKVEKIISTGANIQANEETVIAPAPVSNKETGAGAASTTAENRTAAVGNSRAAGIFKSPWTLSFLGLMALASVAFIFL